MAADLSKTGGFCNSKSFATLSFLYLATFFRSFGSGFVKILYCFSNTFSKKGAELKSKLINFSKFPLKMHVINSTYENLLIFYQTIPLPVAK